MRRSTHYHPKAAHVSACAAQRCPYDLTPEARAERARRVAEQAARVEREEEAQRQRWLGLGMPSPDPAITEHQRQYRATQRGKLAMKLGRIRAEIKRIDTAFLVAPGRFARRREVLARQLEATLAELETMGTEERHA